MQGREEQYAQIKRLESEGIPYIIISKEEAMERGLPLGTFQYKARPPMPEIFRAPDTRAERRKKNRKKKKSSN